MIFTFVRGVSMPKKKEKKIPLIDVDWCKGCRICVEFCPEKALAMNDMEKARLAYPEKCSGCGMCELRCPDLAIELR